MNIAEIIHILLTNIKHLINYIFKFIFKILYAGIYMINCDRVKQSKIIQFTNWIGCLDEKYNLR